MKEAQKVTEGKKNGRRLVSLDILRGFDMLFVVGGEELVVAVAALFGFSRFGVQFGHAEWHGLHFMDLVFPLFLFLAGVSFPFSLAASQARGRTKGAVALKAVRRGLILFALGLAYNGFLKHLDWAHFRVWSVLGRIGLAWMAAALVQLFLGLRARIALAVAILAGVTVFTQLVPAPGSAPGADPFSAEGNFFCWLDRTLTAGHTYQPLFDPEGFAGLLPAVVTAMFGMFVGELLKSRCDRSESAVRPILLIALGLGAAGGAASFVCPVNKALWSPSFSLLAGSLSCLALAFVHWAADVRGWTRWGFFFKVVGMNSIAAYLLQTVVDMKGASAFFFGGLARLLPSAVGAVVTELGFIATCWAVLYYLYRKGTFLKV